MAEAARLGFTRMITGPERGGSTVRRHPEGSETVAAVDLREALRLALIED